MSLLGLPDEIFLDIIEYSKESFDAATQGDQSKAKQHLSRVSRICQRSYALTTPLLYADFTSSKFKPFSLFLRTITSRPELGQHVTRLHIAAFQNDVHSDPRWYNDSERSRIKELIREACLVATEENSNEWFWRICGGSWDAALALLLPLCSGLVRLKIEYWSGDFPYITRMLKRVAVSQATSRPSLPSYQECHLGYWADSGGMQIGSHVLPFLTPSLDRITICGASTTDIEPTLHPGLKLNVSEVIFRSSAVDAGVVANLLLCCPKLRVFSYMGAGRLLKGEGFRLPAELLRMDAFKLVKEKLEILHFHAPGLLPIYSFGRITDRPLDSLEAFKSLRELSIDGALLSVAKTGEGCLVSFLPASLETLILTDPSPVILTQLTQQLSKGAAPNIRKIALVYTEIPVPGPSGSAPIRELAQLNGIRLELSETNTNRAPVPSTW